MGGRAGVDVRGGPKAIYLDALAWLRERKVLLPGVTTLARLVARVRDETTHRLWRVLDRLPEVSPGMRVSDLERWRKGPPPRGGGPPIIAEIQGLGLAGLGAEAVVQRRQHAGVAAGRRHHGRGAAENHRHSERGGGGRVAGRHPSGRQRQPRRAVLRRYPAWLPVVALPQVAGAQGAASQTK